MPRVASQDPKLFALALGLAVQQMRERKGLSQNDLADSVGISQPTLSRIERGLGRADALTLRRLTDALGVTVDHVHAQIDTALARAETAVHYTATETTTQDPDAPWWQNAIGVAGMIGLAGLVGFAIASVLSAEEKEKRAARPTKRRHRKKVT